MTSAMKKAHIRCAVMGSKAVALGGAVIGSMNTFALDTAANTAIDSAITGGETSVAAVVLGVITIAAVVTGAGLVISWLKR